MTAARSNGSSGILSSNNDCWLVIAVAVIVAVAVVVVAVAVVVAVVAAAVVHPARLVARIRFC